MLTDLLAPDSISTVLSVDHDRLDDLLREVRELVDRGDLVQARGRFTEFDAGLRRHIEAEERLLFPAFEVATGVTHGPTEVMRMEHRLIVQDLAALADALGRSDAAAFHDAHDRLLGVLGRHNMKEERILYPACDARVPDEERRVMLERIRADVG